VKLFALLSGISLGKNNRKIEKKDKRCSVINSWNRVLTAGLVKTELFTHSADFRHLR